MPPPSVPAELPLTLLSAAFDDDYLVAEIGSSAAGEIASLAKQMDFELVALELELGDDQRPLVEDIAVSTDYSVTLKDDGSAAARRSTPTTSTPRERSSRTAARPDSPRP